MPKQKIQHIVLRNSSTRPPAVETSVDLSGNLYVDGRRCGRLEFLVVAHLPVRLSAGLEPSPSDDHVPLMLHFPVTRAQVSAACRLAQETHKAEVFWQIYTDQIGPYCNHYLVAVPAPESSDGSSGE